MIRVNVLITGLKPLIPMTVIEPNKDLLDVSTAHQVHTLGLRRMAGHIVMPSEAVKQLLDYMFEAKGRKNNDIYEVASNDVPIFEADEPATSFELVPLHFPEDEVIGNFHFPTIPEWGAMFTMEIHQDHVDDVYATLIEGGKFIGFGRFYPDDYKGRFSTFDVLEMVPA